MVCGCLSLTITLVVAAQEVAIGDRQQAVHIRWQIDARYFRAFVHHHIEEARVLMGEAIVIRRQTVEVIAGLSEAISSRYEN